MRPGDRVEAKVKPGLGGWRPAKLLVMYRDSADVEIGGTTYSVPRSRVRPPKSTAPTPAKQRRCSYCGDVGHDIRKCDKLLGMAGTIREVNVNTITRPFTTSGGELRAVPKPPGPVRSDAFKAFVRTKPCMFCGARPPSDPHHVGPHGIGEKTDDSRTVPCCRKCHDEYHDTRRVKPHSKDATYVMILERQVTLLTEWMWIQGGADGA